MGAALGMARKDSDGLSLWFDFDGTYSRWHTMPTFYNDLMREGVVPMGTDAELYARLQAYRNREGSFADYEQGVVPMFQKILRGRKIEDVQLVAQKLVERNLKRSYVFTRELLAAGLEAKMPCFLVSGGPESVIAEFATRLGFTDYLASAYPHDEGVYTGKEPAHWIGRKGEAMHKLADRYCLNPSHSIVIGDTTSDIEMLENALWPICFNPTRKLYELADTKAWPVVIERKDLILCTRKEIHRRFARSVCTLNSILPQPLAGALEQRLVDIRYF
ncbi:MAG: HAD-IB family phosphatase [Patescibacteria group bacterium]